MALLKSQKFLRLTLLSVIAWLGLRLGLNWGLGVILSRTFAAGTGCEVTLRRPRLELFPLRAEVSDVLIRHPAEPKDAGFSARRLEISMEFLPIFRGEVLLHHLKIEGARAVSIGSDTGFLQTMSFLFPPAKEVLPGSPPPPPSLADSIIIHLTEILIETSGVPEPQFVLGNELQRVRLAGVRLSFVEQERDAKKPYDLVATAERGDFFSGESRKFGRVAVDAALGLGKLALRSASLRGGADSESEIKLSGSMGIRKSGEYNFALEGRFAEPSMRELLPNSPVGYPGSLEVHSTIRGALDRPELEGNVNLSSGANFLTILAEPCRPQQLAAGFKLTPELVRVDDMSIAGTVQGAAIEFRPVDTFIRAKVPFSLAQSEIARECIAIFKRGAASFQQSVQSVQGQLHAEGTLEPRNLAVSLSSDIAMPLASHFEAEATIQTEELAVTLLESARKGGSNRLAASVTVKPALGEIQVKKFQARDLPLNTFAQLLTPVLSKQRADRLAQVVTERTRLDADAEMQANFLARSFASGSGYVVLRSAHLFNSDIPEISLPFEATKESVSISLKPVSIATGVISGGAGFVFADKSLNGVITAEDLNLHQLEPRLRNLPGAARLNRARIDLEGSLHAPKFSLHAEVGSAPRTSELFFDAAGSLRAISLQIKHRSGEFEADSKIDLSEPGKPRVALSGELRSLKLEPLLGGVAAINGGAISGRFQYDATLDRPLLGKGRAELSDFSLSTKAVRITQGGPLQLVLQGGKLEFSRVVLIVGDRPFTIVGTLGAEQGWHLDVNGRWNLAAVPHPEEVIQQLSGDLNLNLQVRGPVQAPQIAGSVEIANAAFAVPVGQDLLDLREGALQGNFQENVFHLRSFRLQTSRGSISGTGMIREPFSESLRDVSLSAALKRITVEPLENLRMAVSGELQFRQAAQAVPSLSGNLHIDRASYEQTIDLIEILQKMASVITGAQRRSVARETSKGGAAPALDIRVIAENDLIVETNIVRAELNTSVHVTGTTSSPLVDGSIGVVEGEFGAESNRFVINSGQAVFAAEKGTLDPDLSLVAETSVVSRDGQDQQVRMLLSGTITHPKVEFVAESGLSQEEIIALLGLRTNVQKIRLINKEKENRSFVDLLNPSSGATLEDRISGITGFSEVQVDTAISGVTGEVVPRLVAKRPLLGRLSLDAMSELSGQQLSILNLSYPLNLFLNAIAGFRNIPPSGSEARSSGSVYVGFRHRSTFSGTSLLPRHLTRSLSPSSDITNQGFGLQRRE